MKSLDDVIWGKQNGDEFGDDNENNGDNAEPLGTMTKPCIVAFCDIRSGCSCGFPAALAAAC